MLAWGFAESSDFSIQFRQGASDACVMMLQAVLEAQIIPAIVHLLTTAEFDIQKEAAWAISNATNGGSPDQIKYLPFFTPSFSAERGTPL